MPDPTAWYVAVLVVMGSAAGLLAIGFGAVLALCRWLDKHDLVISKRDVP